MSNLPVPSNSFAKAAGAAMSSDKVKLALIIIELSIPIATALSKVYFDSKEDTKRKSKGKETLSMYKIEIKEKYKMSGESKELFIQRVITEVESEIRTRTHNGIDSEEEIEDAVSMLRVFMYSELKEEATRTTLGESDALNIHNELVGDNYSTDGSEA